MHILIINGPNLNMLGVRRPDVYGYKSLDEINAYIKDYFKKVNVSFFQSNEEGKIVDEIQKLSENYDGLVINPGALTHYSYAIRDAIEAIDLPVVEIHISNIAAREGFRQKSVISEVCAGTVSGFGIYGYILAVQAIAHQLKDKKA
ncbi:MAG: type II 3-dehydroquinate dehydratase [Calditrichaceae bacterium]|nr:type II 3-dehydroquinate dehydratase [Calditrichaceae bacterium]HES60013.1 type II 3-dehydroquinate dehydratase [Caldithrix sp.]